MTQFVMVSEKIMFLVNFDTFFSFLWGVPAEGLEWVFFYILVRNLARNRTRNNDTFFINFHIFYSWFFIYFYSIYSNWFVSKNFTMLCIYITWLLIFLVKWGGSKWASRMCRLKIGGVVPTHPPCDYGRGPRQTKSSREKDRLAKMHGRTSRRTSNAIPWVSSCHPPRSLEKYLGLFPRAREICFPIFF